MGDPFKNSKPPVLAGRSVLIVQERIGKSSLLRTPYNAKYFNTVNLTLVHPTGFRDILYMHHYWGSWYSIPRLR